MKLREKQVAQSPSYSCTYTRSVWIFSTRRGIFLFMLFYAFRQEERLGLGSLDPIIKEALGSAVDSAYNGLSYIVLMSAAGS